MRILLTADPMIPVPPVGYGGIERIVDALVREYRQGGHEVGLVAHPQSKATTDVTFGWQDLRLNQIAATLRNTLQLDRAVRSFRPDIIHSFSRLAFVLPQLARQTPVIMSYQRHTGGRQIAWASRLGGKNLRFTGCSDFICNMGRPAGGSWTAVHNFAEVRRLTFVPQVADDAPLVFLSRLDDIKGPDLAIAIARAAGRRLVLAGNRADTGPQRHFFDRQIKPWIGRDGIEWIGEVNDTEKNKLLGSAAALLVPIRWNEPFGIVFAEALACGTPVITCPHGATPEIVLPNQTGFLINSLEQGVAAVGRLSTLDRHACRADAEQRFSAEAVSLQYLQIYSSFN